MSRLRAAAIAAAALFVAALTVALVASVVYVWALVQLVLFILEAMSRAA